MGSGERIKIGVIGCGEIAQVMHLPYIADSDEMCVHSLCNTTRSVAEYLAARYGVLDERVFADYRELLNDAELDAVAVCSHDHYEPVMAAIAAGKHVFVEKPLAFCVRQAREMAAAAKQRGVVLQVGYMKIYDPGFRCFLQRFREMGEVRHARVHNFCGNFDYIPQIYNLRKQSSVNEQEKAARRAAADAAVREQIGTLETRFAGPYMDMLLGTTHDTVLLRAMFGDELRVRYADIADDGQTLATLQTPGGLRLTFESHFIDERLVWDENIAVWGPRCELQLVFPSPYLRNAVTKVLVNENDDSGANRDVAITASYEESFREEWRSFCECVRSGKKPLADADGAVCDIQIAADIVAAAMQRDE